MATVWTTQECGLHHFHRHHHFDHHNSGQVGPPMADTGVWSEKPVPAHGVTLPRASYNIHCALCMYGDRYMSVHTYVLHEHIFTYEYTHVVNSLHLSVHCAGHTIRRKHMEENKERTVKQ